MDIKNSPVQSTVYENFHLYIKRDDLLDKEFSGNKARKFYYLLKQDFNSCKKIISFGSTQSNSLYSLSVLAKMKNVKFDFYVKHISTFLKENPTGNYEASLLNNANIIEIETQDIQEYIENKVLNKEENYIYVVEGGRTKEAEIGVKILAQEIKAYVKENCLTNCKIMLPSGTGATALFLQKNLQEIEVLTCACVGGDEYLKKEFLMLESDTNFHPTILKTQKKYHFGKLYKEFYEIYQKTIHQTSIEFDLLYDSLGFLCLNKYLNSFKKEDIPDVIYIHQGGILGNKSMLSRYRRKYKEIVF